MGQRYLKKRMNELLFTAKGLHLSLVTQRPIIQNVQMVSGASQEYFFRGRQRNPKFDNIVRDFAQGFDLTLRNRSLRSCEPSKKLF